MGTGQKEMTWIKDTYNYIYGEKEIHAAGCATGKLLSQGGIDGRTEATGMGCFFVLRELLNNESFCEIADLSSGVKGKRVIVQGFGNVGYQLARILHEEGAKIVGVVERDAGLYSPQGLDPNAVKQHLTEYGTLKNCPLGDEVETQDPTFLFRKKCDIFAPCATDGAVNMHNAQHIKAKVVLEGANGPTTFKGDKILQRKGVIVIPDLLANSGGVTVSYFEWLKNLSHISPGRMTKKYQEQQKNNILKMLGYRFPENSPLMQRIRGAEEIDIVRSGLEEIMVQATREHWEYALKRQVSLREACISKSLEKLETRF
jgi:glutamate dehydrogenase (NAD(P)+)